MKEKLRLKYVPPSFSQQLLDKWNRLIQENKSATNKFAKFDEYLNWCSTPVLDIGRNIVRYLLFYLLSKRYEEIVRHIVCSKKGRYL